jgi:glycosyltransferase involved in cell wall biosynthesis
MSQDEAEGGRIRLLHVITRLDPGGSAENTLLSVALADRRHYAVDLAFGPTRDLGGPTAKAARTCAGRWVEIPRLVRHISPLADMRAVWDLWQLMRQGKYHLVHTHTSKAGVVGRLAAFLARVPAVVHTSHGHVFYGYYGPALSRFFVWVEKAAAHLADRIVALTAVDAAEHVDLGVASPAKFTVVHSGVDFTPLEQECGSAEACRRQLGLDPQGPVVGTVGRLTAIKAQDDLLIAFSQVLQQVPQANLLIVGDGEERGRLEDLACRLGLQERTVFVGWRDDLARVLHAMDIFAFPSLNEGMGKALVEAMYCGVAPVATRVGGVPELVEDGRQGLLVPPSRPDLLAQAITRLLGDKPLRLRLGKAARDKAAGYGAETMIQRLEALYETVLREKGLSR